MDVSTKIAAWAARVIPEPVRHVSWLKPRYPLLALEIREDSVVAVRLDRRGKGFRLTSCGRQSLPAGVFSASLLKSGVGDLPQLGSAIQKVLHQVGAGSGAKLSLALPDTAVKVFLVELAEIPPQRDQAAELIRFRIRKSIPFRPEEARLSWDVIQRAPDGKSQVLVATSPETAIEPLEQLLAQLGYRCGLVDIASFNVLNLARLEGLLESPAGDVAVVDATPAYFSLIILRQGRLVFYRAKSYHLQGNFQGEESLRVVGRELRSSLSYYEEHLGGQGIRGTLLRASGVSEAEFGGVVAESGFGTVKPFRPLKALPELQHLAAENAAELMPAAGLALRRHP